MPRRTRYVRFRVWLRRWKRTWTLLAVQAWLVVALCGVSIALNDFWPLRVIAFVAAIFCIYARGRLDSTLWWIRQHKRSSAVWESLINQGLALNLQQNAWIVNHMETEHRSGPRIIQ